MNEPKGSKNKPKADNPTVPKTPKPPKKASNTTYSTSTTAETPKLTPKLTPKPPSRPRAKYSPDNDKKLMAMFLEQKIEGNATDNGGWKGKALTAAEKALEGSELESGGAPKTATGIQEHWDYLKGEYKVFVMLLEKSGWGWDDENQCVIASDEQWEGLIATDPHLALYRGKTFPIYKEMKELLEGALALGDQTFQPGNTSDSSDLDNSLSEEEETIVGSDPKMGSKCKSSAVGGKPAKRPRRDRGGKLSTASSIVGLTHAIDNVAVAMASSESDADKEAKKKAGQLVQGMDGLSKTEIAKLLLLISKDVSFTELLLDIDDQETLVEVVRLQLAA
ncbi:hypothetical protein D9758_006630 [Tetrapyrgos nigripes]|uniref:Myb/SANT-like domain-containing protein n=1 Tax=Tetrapyrgos nigripes TaxID=182062 RepID=A0A8H5LQA9_9AGAR|nr:hypothetical protein D9758_006630 [Tetrapyrgos nigripes]